MAKKILVVDDEEDIIMMVGARLTANGYEVISAVNGKEGLDRAKSEKPDLIISDVLMPVMDGFALYKELKGDQSTAQIPVLVLTARGKMEDTFAAMGAEEFIPKPFDSQQLVEKVAKLLEGSTSKEKADSPKEKAAEEKIQSLISKGNGTKALLAGNNGAVLDNMEVLLKKKYCIVERALSKGDLINKVEAFDPDIIIMDVLMENNPAHPTVEKIRKIASFNKKPIIIYTHLDQNNLGKETTVYQKTVEIDKAKKDCIDSGATESIGGFDEANFLKAVERYLSK